MNSNNSTGPRTPEGKAVSSQNATKHGLQTSHPQLLPNENPAAFEQLRAEYQADFPPATRPQRDAVDRIAWARWLQFRLDRTESALFTLLADPNSPHVDPAYRAAAQAFIKGSGPDGALSLLNRYAARINRDYERALRDLLRLFPAGPHLGTPSASDGQSPAIQPDTQKLPNELPPLAHPLDTARDPIMLHPEWPAIKDLVYETISPHPEIMRVFLAKLDAKIAQNRGEVSK